MNCIILDISFKVGETTHHIYPVLIQGDNELVLVDAGNPNQLELFEKAAIEKGVDFSKLTKIIITHHDHDHIGSLAAIKAKYPQAEILCSEIDKKHIEGKEKSLRLQQAESIYETLPEEGKPKADAFHKFLASIESVKVDKTINDMDILPICGGIEILATPGHMPGHISVYLRQSKTMIAGDAVVVDNGKLLLPFPQYAINLDEAKKSIRKMAAYDIDCILCYHGGIYKGDCREALITALI